MKVEFNLGTLPRYCTRCDKIKPATQLYLVKEPMFWVEVCKKCIREGEVIKGEG